MLKLAAILACLAVVALCAVTAYVEIGNYHIAQQRARAHAVKCANPFSLAHPC
jgi:preprotein translocase subunit SecY